jgi:hypothetical protein
MSNFKFGHVPAPQDWRRKSKNDQYNSDYSRRDCNSGGSKRKS